LARGRLSEKYQVTIPKEIRQKVHVSPGEVVSIEAISGDEIRLKRFPLVQNPVDILIGKKKQNYKRGITIEELEEKVESR
jgi:AbrB family looped-hinge helix DNA binding protein